MSRRIKIVTTVMDADTNDIISEQISIVTIDEEKKEDKPKNYFGLNNFNNIPHSIEGHINHMKKYGTVNEPLKDSNNCVITEVDLNDEVLAACREYIEN